MTGAFQKISRTRNLLSNTKWYLSEDCLLAAKLTMYTVEYRRFYLRDIESVIIWPSRFWLLRVIIPALVLGSISASLWLWVDSTSGMIFGVLALVWVAAELALGPTAHSRIQTTGANVELRLVSRARRARKVLAMIDAALRATRGIEEPAAHARAAQVSEPAVLTETATSPTTPNVVQQSTNGS